MCSRSGHSSNNSSRLLFCRSTTKVFPIWTFSRSSHSSSIIRMRTLLRHNPCTPRPQARCSCRFTSSSSSPLRARSSGTPQERTSPAALVLLRDRGMDRSELQRSYYHQEPARSTTPTTETAATAATAAPASQSRPIRPKYASWVCSRQPKHARRLCSD